MITALDVTDRKCKTLVAKVGHDKYTVQISNENATQVVTINMNYAHLAAWRLKLNEFVLDEGQKDFGKTKTLIQ